MKSNTIVQIDKKLKQRNYTAEGHVDRINQRGRIGWIIASHDSHGLCYDVKFENGMIATFDADEFTIL